MQPPPHIESTPTVSEMGVKTKTQLLAERTVLRQLVTSVIAASADKDLNPKGTGFPMLFTRVSGLLEPGHTAHLQKCCVAVMLIIRDHMVQARTLPRESAATLPCCSPPEHARRPHHPPRSMGPQSERLACPASRSSISTSSWTRWSM